MVDITTICGALKEIGRLIKSRKVLLAIKYKVRLKSKIVKSTAKTPEETKLYNKKKVS